MLRRILPYAVLAVLAAAAHPAQAQQFPGLGVGHMVQNELAFQQQFYPFAYQRSWELARQIPNNQPLPFNAMTIHNSLNQGNEAMQRYVRGLQYNSNRTGQVLHNYGVHAIRDNAYYANPHGGPVYQLPYTHNVWNVGPYGYARPGYNPYSGNDVYRQGW